MKSEVVCGRYDCKFNANCMCTLKAICIGKDMICQSFFRKDPKDYSTTIAQFEKDRVESIAIFNNVTSQSNLKIYPSK